MSELFLDILYKKWTNIIIFLFILIVLGITGIILRNIYFPDDKIKQVISSLPIENKERITYVKDIMKKETRSEEYYKKVEDIMNKKRQELYESPINKMKTTNIEKLPWDDMPESCDKDWNDIDLNQLIFDSNVNSNQIYLY